MNGPECYAEALRLMNELPAPDYISPNTGLDRAETFQAAQVYATLASVQRGRRRGGEVVT
jgi:hypothetical protein